MITLAHGAGGIEQNQLIEEIFIPALGEFIIIDGEDATSYRPSGTTIVTSIDAFVISPIFFTGGDIGHLCICGSSNDIAVSGAKPKIISISFIIEEGFSKSKLRQIAASIASELRLTGIMIASMDTKVVGKGSADGIFITTCAIGEVLKPLSAKSIKGGDIIISSGAIGTHGAVIYCNRANINLQTTLKSDCAQLYPMLAPLYAGDYSISTIRDATRGGVAAVLNEWAQSSNITINIDEQALHIKPDVSGVCEILGLEALSLANEGMCLLAVDPKDAKAVLEILKSHPLGQDAAVIGSASAPSFARGGRVILHTAYGTSRYIDAPSGELLPRIC